MHMKAVTFFGGRIPAVKIPFVKGRAFFQNQAIEAYVFGLKRTNHRERRFYIGGILPRHRGDKIEIDIVGAPAP